MDSALADASQQRQNACHREHVQHCFEDDVHLQPQTATEEPGCHTDEEYAKR